MSFTDEDLKRLKDAAKAEKWEGSLVALLARLEAAEKCIHAFPGPGREIMDSLEAWKKAAGK